MADATIWEGPSEDIPVVNANGNVFEEVQVAIAAQTLFTLASFIYTPNSHSIFVYKNGTMLRRAVDYTESSSTTVTLTAPAALNDKLSFIAIAINQLIAPVVFNGMPPGGTTGQIITKTSATDYAANWQTPSAAVTLLDAARVNIASASTVNLSAIAATTRNIQITGSVQIDGFQITNGQVWITKFASSLVLKNNANIVTQSGADIKVTPNDTCIIRATADNVVEIISYARAASGESFNNFNEFRLSLTTGVPVTTADVVAGTNLYCVPYKGNKISLYNGTAWVVRESAQFTIALAGLTANRPYDVFCYDNAGVPTLELLAWTSAAVRATVLTSQDGVYVKSGDTTRKYLGTFYALSATTTTDSKRQRLLWNYYNRVRRNMSVVETAASWVYTVAAFRQANANVNNQLEYVCGVQEDSIEFTVRANSSTTVPGTTNQIGVGVDSTTVNSAQCLGRNDNASGSGVGIGEYKDYALVGYHFYVWLELSGAAGVTTWQGTGTNVSGFLGSVIA